MKRMFKGLIAATVFSATGITVYGSSHREALAILNEPCADNTDTYAWVSDGAHDKLYLIMNFNPLHEPGQGNQGLRACRSPGEGNPGTDQSIAGPCGHCFRTEGYCAASSGPKLD
jgi:hypothetical protein